MSGFYPVFLVGISILMLSPVCVRTSRILVVPVDGSHWINMKILLEELHARGHNITVLRSPKSWYIPQNSSIYTSIDIFMLEDESDLDYYNRMLLNNMECRRSLSLMRTFCQQSWITSMLNKGHRILAKASAKILDDPAFINRMKEAEFDLMLTDPGLTLGVILGNYLKLPMVFNVRWINSGEGHLTVAPSPLSYVPVSGSELHDQMNFLERAKNMLHYLYSVGEHLLFVEPPYTDVFRRHFPPGTSLLSLQLAADIWLIRTDFVFEFPRPTMPNVIYIGGFQCKDARPLSAELEEFMQSSGEHGVVVMSLGTLVSALPHGVTEAIAGAFAALPQKVVWRFEGEKPSSLGNNTLLLKWLPQTDLLGHPKTRAFVAHGGTNGLYEAIYHGVPVLGLPLLFDQFDNVHRLKVRGAARVVEAHSLTKEDFLEALTDILETPSYRTNIKRLSRIHKDKPESPMDTAVFWTEYVIRNRGAAHLQSAGFNLSWYTYFCLDIAATVLIFTCALVWALAFLCRAICCRKADKVKAE